MSLSHALSQDSFIRTKDFSFSARPRQIGNPQTALVKPTPHRTLAYTQICYKQLKMTFLYSCMIVKMRILSRHSTTYTILSVIGVAIKTTFHSRLFLKHRSAKITVVKVSLSFCYDIQTTRCLNFSRCENIASHNVRMFVRRLVLSLQMLWEDLEKVAHQTDWHLVALSVNFCSSNNNNKERHWKTARRNAFALFWLSHLFVSPERSSLFVTYQVHLVLEMSRDRLVTDRNLISWVWACCKLVSN